MPEWGMRTRRITRGVATAELACAMLLAGAVRAQAPSDPAAADDSDQQAIFQTQIEVVTIPVTVTNSSGEFVTDLNPGGATR